MFENSLLKKTHSIREAFKKLAPSNKLNEMRESVQPEEKGRRINIHAQTF